MSFFNIDIEEELYIIFIIFVILFIMIFYDRYKYHKIITSLHYKYDQEINILKDTLNSINEKNKQSIKYNQTFRSIDDLLNNIDNRITEQDQSLETIFDVILSMDHKIAHHVQLFEENKESIKNTNKTLDETNKTLDETNKTLEEVTSQIGNHTHTLKNINDQIIITNESLEDIYNKNIDHDKLLEDINDYPDIICPITLLRYQYEGLDNRDEIIHEGKDYEYFNEKYNNKIIDIKNIDTIKFKLLYNSTNS